MKFFFRKNMKFSIKIQKKNANPKLAAKIPATKNPLTNGI